MWDASSPYNGKIAAYDSPIYIADAALYLMATKPDLGIENPYALDQKQFDAAIDLLKEQKPAGRRVLERLRQGRRRRSRAVPPCSGPAGRYIANLAKADEPPVTDPAQGGLHRLVRHLDGASKAAHPNCAYQWMNHIISPKANAQVAESFGEAPANRKSCQETSDMQFCDHLPRRRRELLRPGRLLDHPDQAVRRRPEASVCKDYSEWTTAWTEVKG